MIKEDCRLNVRVSNFLKTKLKIKLEQDKINLTDFLILCVNGYLDENEDFLKFLKTEKSSIKLNKKKSKKIKELLATKSAKIEQAFDLKKSNNGDFSSNEIVVLYDILEKNSLLD